MRDRYLELLKGCLTRTLCLEDGADIERRNVGLDWPVKAETMIGLARMDNIRFCVEEVLRNNVPGDLIECGVWRGGACIYMKAILEAYASADRKVYVADSFNGFPVPSNELDKAAEYLDEEILCVSRQVVEENFCKYGLLDERVQFIEGYFSVTLPKFEGQLALLRVDADLYESTMDVLVHLYDKVSIGGFVIVDDVFKLNCCNAAVNIFRGMRKIKDELVRIDHAGGYWQKTK